MMSRWIRQPFQRLPGWVGGTGEIMALAFNIVLNGLLIAAMAFFVVALVALILATQEPLERALRAAAAFTGALVVLGAQASGVSYANFIVKSLEQNKTVGIGFLAAGLPALAGVGIGWYFVHSMKRSNRSEERRVGKDGRSRWSPYH